MAFPWICLPNSGKNTLGYSNFSYSNFQLFKAISIPVWANYRLNQPRLFELFLLGDRRLRTVIFFDWNTFFSWRNQASIFMAKNTLRAISSKVQYSPLVISSKRKNSLCLLCSTESQCLNYFRKVHPIKAKLKIWRENEFSVLRTPGYSK